MTFQLGGHAAAEQAQKQDDGQPGLVVAQGGPSSVVLQHGQTKEAVSEFGSSKKNNTGQMSFGIVAIDAKD